MNDPSKGDIWQANLGQGVGHEQSNLRPVLIVSEDEFNAGPAGLVIVVPLTTKIAKSRHIPAHILISPPEGGLRKPSAILCDQIRAISKDRLGGRPWGQVAPQTLMEVGATLRMLIGAAE
jgi:mRNA interferase MazF